MEDLQNTIQRRNRLLENFFNKIFPEKITVLTLNPNAPAVIHDSEICLSCYVHNFELRFTDKPDKGNLVYSIELMPEPKYDVERILDWYSNSEHKKMYKVKLKDSNPPLYLSGYNFRDKVNKRGQHPVFARYNPRIYFHPSKAEEIVRTLYKEGYIVVSC